MSTKIFSVLPAVKIADKGVTYALAYKRHKHAGQNGGKNFRGKRIRRAYRKL